MGKMQVKELAIGDWLVMDDLETARLVTGLEAYSQGLNNDLHPGEVLVRMGSFKLRLHAVATVRVLKS